ncbi:MAG: flagellar hook-associated protein FlgK [Pseudomonadota bacterium]
MSTFDTIRIGQTGLRAASTALDVVGHNVANASTEGYHARTLGTSAAAPVTEAGCWLGMGTEVSEIRRAADDLLSTRLVDAQGEGALQASLYDTLSVVETMFSETDEAGLSTRLSEFFDSLETASLDPSDSSLRRGVLSAAGSLASAVSDTWSFLESTAEGTRSELSGSLEDINAALEEIASLQAAIESDAGTIGQGDLLDRRDALVSELASSLGVSVSYGEGNELTLFLGGHALVNDGAARTLSYGTDADGDPVISLSTGGSSYDVTSSVGGAMGGLLQAHDTVSSLQDDLDEFAATFADAFNTQHAAGYDTDGAAGGDFFSYSASGAAASFAVDASLAADPNLMALAAAPTASAGDGGNLSALIDLQDATLFSSGTAETFISGIYSEIGQQTASASTASEGAAATIEDLGALYDSMTGVDLDAQAVELIQWQAAYQAAARVISAGDAMLDELMGLV